MSKIEQIKRVETPEELENFIEKILPVDHLYIDLEMNNTHFFKPIICLIQILAEDTCYLIDPLSIKDLSSLFKAFEYKNFIIHGCDYDVRCLHQNYNYFITNVFDTMIAGQFLNYDQVGLNHLVKKFFKISLNKKYQRANWFKRPLTLGMIKYAAQDTFYLPKIKDNIYKQLKKKKKLHWYQEYFENYLADLNQKLINPEVNIWKIQGSNKFCSLQLQALKAVWNWRENFCEKNNLSRSSFLSNQRVLKIISFIPQDLNDSFSWVNIISEAKNKTEVQNIIEDSWTIDPSLWPEEQKRKSIKQKMYTPQIISELKTVRDKISVKYNISIQVLPKKRVLEKLGSQPKLLIECKNLKELNVEILSWQEEILLKPWQKHLKKWCKRYHVSF